MADFWTGLYVGIVIGAVIVAAVIWGRRIRVVTPGGLSLAKQRAKLSATKKKNHDAIVLYVREHGSITNDIVERLVGVSDATATRYLDDLESEGIIIEQGSGRGVSYRLVE